MKIRVAFLLALALLSFGASMLVSTNAPMPGPCANPYSITRNVGLHVEPSGDPVDGPDLPH